MVEAFLTQFIYTHTTPENIEAGRKKFLLNQVAWMPSTVYQKQYFFVVKESNSPLYFKVFIDIQENDPTPLITAQCNCNYPNYTLCTHKVAALFKMQYLADKNALKDISWQYNQLHTTVEIKVLEEKQIKHYAAGCSFSFAQLYLKTKKMKVTRVHNERVYAAMREGGMLQKVIIQRNEKGYLDTSCTCNTEVHYPLCKHKTTLLLQLLYNFGAYYFDTIKDWSYIKNKLLANYGFTLKDHWEEKFEFAYREGKPFLKIIDTSLLRLPIPLPVAEDKKPTSLLEDILEQPFENKLPPQSLKEKTVLFGIFIQPNLKNGIRFDILPAYSIGLKEKDGHRNFIEKINVENLYLLQKLPIGNQESYALIQSLQQIAEKINQIQSLPFVPDKTEKNQAELLLENYLSDLQNLFIKNCDNPNTYYIAAQELLKKELAVSISLSAYFILPEFTLRKVGAFYEISCVAKLPYNDVCLHENELNSNILFLHQQQLFTWQKMEDIELIQNFLPVGSVLYNNDEWSEKLHQFILPLSKKYVIQFEDIPLLDLRDVDPQMQIYLHENDDYLIFEVVFSYNGWMVKYGQQKKALFAKNDQIIVVHRNIDAEHQLYSKLFSLHSQFEAEENSYTLKIEGQEALKGNWFYLFTDEMKQRNIAVFGVDNLKNYSVTRTLPNTRIFFKTNTDWFDAHVEILFGNQAVTVADIKKSLTNKQQYVLLSDGSMGILPEEWIKKYALLFKIGEGKTNVLRINKYHYNLVEDLINQNNETAVVDRLEEKYENLKTHIEVPPAPVPIQLQTVLRPYQESGFQWLNYLSTIRWGGILADDMGLGKTLQALTFLYYYKQTYGRLRALVICPTTLLFNWKNEIQKFTPSLSCRIYHGNERKNIKLLELDIDIIITTYGTVRRDVKKMAEIEFDYTILDESQAIKNPISKITKAVNMLNAKNKLCLSGTPLQNNTFDIFAQMNFLNPGMLGSPEFFKNEFAIPIDKFGEKEQKQHLKKLLFPFILRRTKEQVAQDLPAKQEIILYCEMGAAQRTIYDAYRNEFRNKVKDNVSKQGLAKSQLTILQGLMKLRQICDSPKILKDIEVEIEGNCSAKIDELSRELTENISNHKVLIFSQFLGMLSLIKRQLEKLGIRYEYFDGSTPPAAREVAINHFQENDACRVFLISLKAGGVGLNLTAADYVYIMDPWWNPAVEQQAIDRTHRIGQTKNIFAYRMICTNTVEDKILHLQEKKKALAKAIITDDDGFVKSLTEEDIDYLFS